MKTILRLEELTLLCLCMFAVISCNAMLLQRTLPSHELIIARIKQLDNEISRREALVAAYKKQISLFNMHNKSKKEQRQIFVRKAI